MTETCTNKHRLTFLKNYLHWFPQKSYCTSERLGLSSHERPGCWAALSALRSAVWEQPLSSHTICIKTPFSHRSHAAAQRACVQAAPPCGRTLCVPVGEWGIPPSVSQLQLDSSRSDATSRCCCCCNNKGWNTQTNSLKKKQVLKYVWDTLIYIYIFTVLKLFAQVKVLNHYLVMQDVSF